jgi:hypothetical protein
LKLVSDISKVQFQKIHMKLSQISPLCLPKELLILLLNPLISNKTVPTSTILRPQSAFTITQKHSKPHNSHLNLLKSEYKAEYLANLDFKFASHRRTYENKRLRSVKCLEKELKRVSRSTTARTQLFKGNQIVKTSRRPISALIEFDPTKNVS